MLLAKGQKASKLWRDSYWLLPAAAQRVFTLFFFESSPLPVTGYISHMALPNRRWPGDVVLPRDGTGMTQQYVVKSLSNSPVLISPGEEGPFQEPVSGLPPSVCVPWV